MAKHMRNAAVVGHTVRIKRTIDVWVPTTSAEEADRIGRILASNDDPLLVKEMEEAWPDCPGEFVGKLPRMAGDRRVCWDFGLSYSDVKRLLGKE